MPMKKNKNKKKKNNRKNKYIYHINKVKYTIKCFLHILHINCIKQINF